jgi:endoglucanase Acf2
MKKFLPICSAVAASLIGLPISGQQPVKIGKASYAAYPPAYKASTDQHSGFNASWMLTRKIYADETDANGNARPIPTNDWWTDVLNNEFSGALWSYPAMLKTAAEGITVAYPTHWNDNGTEVKSDSWLKVQGAKFTAKEARAVDWHDWDVEILLPATSGNGSIKATLAHGIPFSWFEFSDVTPELTFSATPQQLQTTAKGCLLQIGNDLYAVYFPEGTVISTNSGAMRFDGATWLSIALLGSTDDFEAYMPYSSSIIRSTTVSWSYDESSSLLTTSWQANAENLRNPSASTPVMQGFLPHAYKYAVNSAINYNSKSYLTPRGTLKMATADDGHFEYAYRFSGMLPYYAAPKEGDTTENGYNPELMQSLIQTYADGGGFGSDTYWGGKGLTQMALNMTFAKQTGNNELYQQSRQKLRNALVDWLTYTPGESTKFFSYFPRWGGMLGFDVSYDSDAFNDHHFHYGYFIYAAALLCMEDDSFRADYGDLLRMIVKDYANYDHNDSRFPFLRTLDPWAGHSYAGGLGDHGNDNGNGQESSSEAMQSWGGVYLLGVALGDQQMRDAGIFGWLTESRGTVEYWFDRDHIHSDKEHNYDYTLYQSPYNTNLTSKGIGWWTWFSGDPLWMHSIQWMPVSPCLNYMSEDLDFVKWDYEQMRSATAYSWFEKNGDEAALADQSVGNVVLCYMERYAPQEAAQIFDEAWEKNMGIARGVDTGHISYFVIHSHLTYGDIDFDVTADCPTANAYRRSDGSMSYMVYNPDNSTRKVNFYRNGVIERSVNAPAKKLTVFAASAEASSLTITSESGQILPPATSTNLTATLFDQYGAEFAGESIAWSVTDGASITNDGVLSIPSTTAKGTTLTVTANSGNISDSLDITVNDAPVVKSAAIEGVPDFVEIGSTCQFSLKAVDQYGAESSPEATWEITDADGNKIDVNNGEATFEKAGRYTIKATAATASASDVLAVVPQLPNICGNATAYSSSEENAGTKTEYAIDGDTSTRWGSAHSDEQWFMLDLGDNYRISSVTINWEAAYAADYDILVAPDGADINDDAAWTTAYSQRSLSSAGIVRHSVAATCRYVKVNCLRRATVYGYSIIEMEVGGVQASASSNAIVGIDIDAPDIIMEGEETELAARGYNINGEIMTLSSTIEWSCSPEGSFNGNKFTPSTYGVYTLTATCGSASAQKQILVEESTKLTSLSVSPTQLSLLTGDEATVEIEGANQFGGIYPISAESLSITLTDSEGNPTDSSIATFDSASSTFRALVRGDYVIDFGGMASVSVSVRDVAEANLAAGKSARSSSYSGGNTADKVTDLDLTTRWESASNDNEWISIDLEAPYVLNQVKLYWEAAYSKAYAIATSLDGDQWFTVYETTEGSGGNETITLPNVPASNIKLLCNERATVYGNSLYEIEVYGSERFTATDDGIAPKINSLDISTDNGLIEGSATFSKGATSALFATATLYSVDNTPVGSCDAVGTSISFTFDGLTTATYKLVVTVEDAFGNKASQSREINVAYSVDGINLALRKPATATSAENNNLSADKAVDGDYSTRWGSQFEDEQSITVNLLETYLVNNVHIFWNSPAYASSYSVELSLDGTDFSEVYTTDGWTGNDDNITFAATPARYVRVTGHTRATQYGTSINELEVYGTDYTAAKIDTISNATQEDQPIDVYSLQGILLLRQVTLREARRLLPHGIYLVGARKLVL